jgi:hypothetical protein
MCKEPTTSDYELRANLDAWLSAGHHGAEVALGVLTTHAVTFFWRAEYMDKAREVLACN